MYIDTTIQSMRKSISRKPSCPGGMTLRESYIAKSGKRVSARCVRKTGLMRGKSSERMYRMLARASMRAAAASMRAAAAGIHVPKRCPKGMTLRAGYTRKSYTRKTGALVTPKCIPTRGLSGKKSKVILLDDHFLSEYGYHDVGKITKEQRLEAINKLLAHFIPTKGEMAAYNYVIRALNARYILNRNTNPKIAKIFKTDQKMVSKIYKQIKKTI
jgi:hypothetical protein